MRYTLLIFIAIFLISCTFKLDNCNAKPTVTQNKNPQAPSDSDEKSLIDEVERHVNPGAELTCTY